MLVIADDNKHGVLIQAGHEHDGKVFTIADGKWVPDREATVEEIKAATILKAKTEMQAQKKVPLGSPQGLAVLFPGLRSSSKKRAR